MKKFLLLSGLLLFSLIIFPLSGFAENAHAHSELSNDQVEEKIDHIMDKYIGKDIPGASLAIVKDGKVLLQKGYGTSNIEKDIKVDPNKTVFEAGSVSKLYTWSAVMQLVEQGKIDLHKDIREYLPEDYLDLDFPQKVTMLELMSHTAGFEDNPTLILTKDPGKVIPLKDYLSKKYPQPSQVFQPGEITAYSNFSASLAGYIIERVSGEDYADYMQKHVLDKLDMKHASFESDYSNIPRIADFKGENYKKTGGNFEPLDPIYINDVPAGALNTTVADMAHFMLAQLGSNNYQLFEKKHTLKKMHEQIKTIHKRMPGNAHGFWERYVGDHRVLEHSGNTEGYTSQLLLVPDENFGIALLMNVAGEHSGLRVDLIEQLIGKHVYSDQITKSANDQKVKGTYRMARGIYTNLMKLLSVASNDDVTIKPDPSGGITLSSSANPKPIHYTETEDPLVYKRVDDTKSLMDKAGMDTSRIAFQLDEKQHARKMSHGIISDYLPVPLKDRFDVNLVIVLISITTFIVYAIALTIHWFIRRRKKLGERNGYQGTSLLTGAGLLVTLNLTALISRIAVNPYQELDTLNIHLWVNWLFPIAIIVSAYFIVKQFKKTKPLMNCARGLLLVVSCVFSIFLLNFHLF